MPDIGIHKKGEINLPMLLEKVRRNLPETVGAIGCFIGVVRGRSSKGEKVKLLDYESSEEALKKLKEIAEEIEQRKNIERVAIHHVVDELKPGEDAVYVVIAGKGREDVFKALPDAMNLVKTKAPIWKKEVTKKGARWGHETG
ncbi:MAG: molybdenum cofactor biosynthesis protein MoaE [Candidatus Hadarchaeota archaeon]